MKQTSTDFNALFDKEARLIYHYFYAYVYDEQTAVILTQKTFARAAGRLSHKPVSMSLSFFLGSQASKVFAKWIRDHEVIMPVDCNFPRFLQEYSSYSVMKGLEKLEDPEQEVVRLYLLGALSLKEIAGLKGLPVHTIERIFYAGKEHLLQMMEKYASRHQPSKSTVSYCAPSFAESLAGLQLWHHPVSGRQKRNNHVSAADEIGAACSLAQDLGQSPTGLVRDFHFGLKADPVSQKADSSLRIPELPTEGADGSNSEQSASMPEAGYTDERLQPGLFYWTIACSGFRLDIQPEHEQENHPVLSEQVALPGQKDPSYTDTDVQVFVSRAGYIQIGSGRLDGPLFKGFKGYRDGYVCLPDPRYQTAFVRRVRG